MFPYQIHLKLFVHILGITFGITTRYHPVGNDPVEHINDNVRIHVPAATTLLYLINEPSRGKTKNVVSEQV